MKKITNLLAVTLLSLMLLGNAAAQKTAESDIEKLAKEIIPVGAEIIHKTVEGKFAESATKDTSNNVVVLYNLTPDAPTTRYEISVLVPQGFEAWDKYQLPEPEYTWSIMEPVSVFFANADRDPENELFVLEKCMTGIGPTGAQYFYRTRVYDWSNGNFRHMETVSEKIEQANTAAKVKKALPQIIKTSRTEDGQNYLITSDSIGDVKIGMTVAEVRQTLKPIILSRTSDGDGAALIEVKRGEEILMNLYAGEEDSEAPVDDKAVVEFIETWNPDFRTSEGIRPRTKLSELEKQYGAVKEIIISEIEAREFADFERQPDGIQFRAMNDFGMAGIYEKDEMTTTKYDPAAFVGSIQVVGSRLQGTRIEVSKETGIGMSDGFLKEKGDQGKFLVWGEAGKRMKVSIVDSETPDEEGAVMIGYVKSPDGGEEGNVGGVIFDEVLKESGNYRILIKQNEAKSGAAKVSFKVKVTIEDKDAFQVLDVEKFNEKIEKAAKEERNWVKTPFLVLANLIQPFSEMGSRKVEMVSPFSDITESVTATVIDDGYADDSVRGEKFVFELELTESGAWKVVSAKKAQVCRENRGHQDYSTKPCV
ncbi:MAG: hypothetical protein R2681_00145 [Pyrinomonadaceae bacterium]